ncbi:MAG TPA: NAD-dependent epimerase/dehydratase family protein, partial [Gallionellaceae bacterium]|nr:NAD-dependent epimerase/dehydratase family protein [Gallionellaceae bacterium]
MPEDRILITGANGFVGQALCNELLRRGQPVTAATRRTWLDTSSHSGALT